MTTSPLPPLSSLSAPQVGDDHAAVLAPYIREALAKTFQVGVRYWAQSACDSNCVWWFTVTARTAKFVTLEEDGGERMRVRVRRGEHPDAEEWTMPFGTYSMAPVVRASRTADDLPPSLRPAGAERT